MDSNSFKKRVKRRITGREHDFFVICSPGLKKTCYSEMQKLGFEQDQLLLSPGGVAFKARPDSAMLANLYLRTPSRILMRIVEFKATSFEQLEKKLNQTDWPLYLPAIDSLKINVTSRKSRLYHSDAIALRAEKIILRQFNHCRTIPENIFQHTLFIRAEHDQFTISLDTSGELLFKRGLKTRVTQAPLRETIASAILLWNKIGPDDIIYDPMCGSGTFSLEAAMIKTATPPGLFRPFAFDSFPGFSSKTFQFLKKKSQKEIQPCQKKQIFASDINEKALAALKKNRANHEFFNLINIEKQDFFSINPAKHLANRQKGIVVLNPPYGKRLAQNGITTKKFYREIKGKLESDFKGWRLGIMLPSKKDMALFNMKFNIRPVFHGGLNAVAGTGVI